MARIVALVSLAFVLALINWSVFQKEQHIANGRVVYLDLTPVDPRSLMQGDYMDLRFRIGTEVYDALPKYKDNRGWQHNADATDGYVVVKLDARKVASYRAIYNGQTLADDEMLLRYRVRNGTVKFATNAFFFQEGNGKYYQPARYGQFRVDAKGELLLVAMYDQDLNKLGPIADESMPGKK